ncbi:MAG TPA: hypothetical protein PLF98_07340, partial [Thermotogota bacterium]|nr:hypothetical protein [Thermotogota bacterium]
PEDMYRILYHEERKSQCSFNPRSSMIGSLFSLAFTKRLERRSSLFQLPIFHAASPPVAYHVSFEDELPSVRAVLSDGFL